MICFSSHAGRPLPCERSEQTESLNEKHFDRFMDLPLSIRYMIYELLLVRGKVFVSNSTAQYIHSTGTRKHKPPSSPLGESVTMQNGGYQYAILPYTRDTYTDHPRQRYLDLETCSPPETGILQGVSKSIQEEAQHIFWSAKNLFVFPAGDFVFPKYYHSMSHISLYDPPGSKLLAKAVSYTFDMRDAGLLDPYYTREHHKFYRGDDGLAPFDDLTSAQKMQRLHDILEKQVERVWNDRCFLLTRHLRLDRLQLDFGECYCALGCCRKVEYVGNQLVYHAAFTHICYRCPFRYGFPRVFEIIGCKDEAERAMLRDRLAGGCRVGTDAFTFVDAVEKTDVVG